MGILDKVKDKEDQKFQHYSSSRQSMRMITTTGRKVIFVNYRYITCEKEIMAYLDDEIEGGLNVITKGDLLTSKEADPMEALKTKHIAEYLLTQQEAAKDAAIGITKDMGTTKSKEALANALSPVSSKGVTNADKQ